jgi:hypothetical protein
LRCSFSSASRIASYWFDSDRVEAGEHLRLDLLEAGQRRGGAPVGARDGVADLGGAQLLDAGDDETDLARGEAFLCLDLGVNTPTCSQR